MSENLTLIRSHFSGRGACVPNTFATLGVLPRDEAVVRLQAIQDSVCAKWGRTPTPVTRGTYTPVWRTALIRFGLGEAEMGNPPRVTFARFAERHPGQRWLVASSRHMAAVVDGAVVDTWDSRRCFVTAAFRVEGTTLNMWPRDEPAPALIPPTPPAAAPAGSEPPPLSGEARKAVGAIAAMIRHRTPANLRNAVAHAAVAAGQVTVDELAAHLDRSPITVKVWLRHHRQAQEAPQ